jgi:UDP-N-acetylmuramoylalanine--D-glutamate ligase
VSLWFAVLVFAPIHRVHEDAMDVAGKRVVVVGLARSGVAAAGFLARRGARVLATDRKPEGELEAEALSLRSMGVDLELGAHRAETLTAADLVVVSPGVPWDLRELAAARARGVPVMAELELGFRFVEGRVAAVTGTKGKSTTTAALGAMLKEMGRDVRVGGNIGQAVTGLLEGATSQTQFVLEVSSFQLEGVDTFRPHVAVFLNLSTDHLDRHPTFEEYARAKARVFRNQTADDWAVVNAEDPRVMALAGLGQARQVPFHPAGAPSDDPDRDESYFKGDDAEMRFQARRGTLFRRSEVRLPGAHLASDLLAAATAARLMGAAPEAIARAVRRFDGVPHVLERVAELDGVAFFNDSKATNVDAARRSLEAFSGPVLAVIGGRFKGGDFVDLAPALEAHGKAVFAIGESRHRVRDALSAVVPVFDCGSLEEAVELAWEEAERGDTVLLAPACSSFDMFKDYADRGDSFRRIVLALVERNK